MLILSIYNTSNSEIRMFRVTSAMIKSAAVDSSMKWISLGQILSFSKIGPGQLYKKIYKSGTTL